MSSFVQEWLTKGKGTIRWLWIITPISLIHPRHHIQQLTSIPDDEHAPTLGSKEGIWEALGDTKQL